MTDRHCKNCNSLIYAGKSYCSDCGAKWIDNRITIKQVGSRLWRYVYRHRYKVRANICGLVQSAGKSNIGIHTGPASQLHGGYSLFATRFICYWYLYIVLKEH